MSTFREVLEIAKEYDARFVRVKMRTARNDILPALGYETRSLFLLDGTDYPRFISLCERYIADPDDEAVYLVK